MIRGDKIIPLGIPTNVAIIGLRLITRFVGVDVARAQIERNES
jgi:hypothetical protein